MKYRIRRPGPSGDIIEDRDIGPGPVGQAPRIGSAVKGHRTTDTQYATGFRQRSDQQGNWK